MHLKLMAKSPSRWLACSCLCCTRSVYLSAYQLSTDDVHVATS